MMFRHFKSATGQLDPDALVTGASDAGELFAAGADSNHNSSGMHPN